MMDTIFNLGLNDEVVEGLTRKTGNAVLHGTLTVVSYRCMVT